MNKGEENKLMMLKAVLSLLKLYRTVWQGSVPFAAAVTELEAVIAEIDAIWQNADRNLSGLIANKIAIQKALITKGFEIASQVYAMAAGKDDKILLGKVDFSKSELENLRDGALPKKIKSVLDIGREQIEALANYTTSDDLDELESLNESYIINLPVHRVSVSGRKGDNAMLRELMKKAVLLLTEQLDRMMAKYEKPKSEFYVAYFNARKIVNYGTRYNKGDDPANP